MTQRGERAVRSVGTVGEEMKKRLAPQDSGGRRQWFTPGPAESVVSRLLDLPHFEDRPFVQVLGEKSFNTPAGCSSAQPIPAGAAQSTTGAGSHRVLLQDSE